MPNFIYLANKTIYDKKGEKKVKRVKGQFTAQNIEEASELLLKMGYEVLDIKKPLFDFSAKDKLSQKELISFFSSMASMDKVGVNVLSALELMKNEVADSTNLKKVCEKIYFSVANGMQLSEACKQASISFSHDVIGLIQIAENTGKFYDIFTEIVSYLKWNFDTKMRAKKAIRGPLATLAFMITMIIVLSTVMLPKVIDFISYFDVETPIYTQVLITFATFVKTKWYLILGIGLAIYFGIKSLAFASEEISVKIDYLKLKIPLFGMLMLKIDTSRFITFFSIMYKNNADVLAILDSVVQIVSNRYFGRRIAVVRQRIADGETIFGAINQEKTFPSMFRRMMSICENTGEVGPVLENVRYFYDTEVKDTTEKVVSMIKPTTTIILGLLVAWMGSAMLGPIYTNIGSIGDMTSTSAGY